MPAYLNNAEFLEALKIYKHEKKEGNENSTKYKRAYNKIGKAISLIANNLSNNTNFFNYTYKDEMISDAIENCFIYLDNFDPDYTGGSVLANTKNRPKSGQVNPFAYFTQICYFAFIRRIKKEKKQSKIKAKLIKDSGILDIISANQDGDDIQYTNAYIETLKSFIDNNDMDEPEEIIAKTDEIEEETTE